MDILPPLKEGIFRWIDSVAGMVNGLLGAPERTSHFSAYQKIDIALDSFPQGNKS
jgi:hypothetical protein